MDIYSRSLVYKNSRKERIKKIAASLLTPEAEQAAMMGAAPGGAPANTQVPPEILSDMEFVQFLQMTAGIVFDPNVMSFIGPDGSMIPADMILQAYDAFNQQRAMSQGAAQGGAPMDPAMGGIELASLEKTISALDKRISSMMNKLDSMQDMLNSITNKTNSSDEDKSAISDMRNQLAKELELSAANTNNMATDVNKSNEDATRASLYNILSGNVK